MKTSSVLPKTEMATDNQLFIGERHIVLKIHFQQLLEASQTLSLWAYVTSWTFDLMKHLSVSCLLNDCVHQCPRHTCLHCSLAHSCASCGSILLTQNEVFNRVNVVCAVSSFSPAAVPPAGRPLASIWRSISRWVIDETTASQETPLVTCLNDNAYIALKLWKKFCLPS